MQPENHWFRTTNISRQLLSERLCLGTHGFRMLVSSEMMVWRKLASKKYCFLNDRVWGPLASECWYLKNYWFQKQVSKSFCFLDATPCEPWHQDCCYLKASGLLKQVSQRFCTPPPECWCLVDSTNTMVSCMKSKNARSFKSSCCERPMFLIRLYSLCLMVTDVHERS